MLIGLIGHPDGLGGTRYSPPHLLLTFAASAGFCWLRGLGVVLTRSISSTPNNRRPGETILRTRNPGAPPPTTAKRSSVLGSPVTLPSCRAACHSVTYYLPSAILRATAIYNVTATFVFLPSQHHPHSSTPSLPPNPPRLRPARQFGRHATLPRPAWPDALKSPPPPIDWPGTHALPRASPVACDAASFFCPSPPRIVRGVGCM